MLILGLCVAHDAGVALIDSGRVVGLVQRERWDRRKRSALITPDFLEHALTQLGVTWNEIDVVAIATCQSWPFLFTEPARFRFSVSSDAAARLPVNVIGLAEATRQAEGALKQLEHLKAHRVNQIKDGLYSEYIGVDISGLDPHASADRCVEWTSYRARWLDTSPKRPSIQAAVADTLSREHQPIGYLSADVTFDGVTKPGLLVPHHLAHAAYGFYQSGEERSAIATLDNGDVMGALNGYVGGILAFGSGAKLSVIDFRFAFEGHLYQRVGEFVGLGQPSGVAGKLMGLAPYGDITYFDEGLVGDAIRLYGEDYAHGRKNERFHVLQPLANRLAAVEGSVPDAPLDGIDRDANGAINLTRLKTRLAATAQAVMEENTLATLRSLHDGFVRAGTPLDAVVLSGGTALNCPANTRAARETPFDRVRVAPAVDDSGLPIGAAQAVAHDLLGLKRPDVDPNSAALAYLGAQYDEAAVERALATAGNAVRVIDTGNAALAAARDLAADRVIAWFEGRSEIGPRALGHRSILADPRPAGNWRRVNALKKRETWRPFAPAVLSEKANEWFDGPLPSAHMLFTAKVRGKDLPAITHVDGSARVQTVGQETGGFRRVLEAFDAETGVPVVMNTSFNGPGEPIVETPEQAIAFLRSSEIDAVYLEGRKLVRAAPDT